MGYQVDWSFDNLEHSLIMRAVKKHTNSEWMLLYIERWLKAPIQLEDGTLVGRDRGTPQGSVITPPTMLQNAPCGARFKRELIYLEHNIHLAFLDLHTLDQCPNNVTRGCQKICVNGQSGVNNHTSERILNHVRSTQREDTKTRPATCQTVAL